MRLVLDVSQQRIHKGNFSFVQERKSNLTALLGLPRMREAWNNDNSCLKWRSGKIPEDNTIPNNGDLEKMLPIRSPKDFVVSLISETFTIVWINGPTINAILCNIEWSRINTIRTITYYKRKLKVVNVTHKYERN